MSAPLIAGLCLLVFLISITFAVKYLIKKDERDIRDTRRVILYNRRTRFIKEMFEKDYVEDSTWRKVVSSHISMYDVFLRYLQDKGIMSKEKRPKYLGRASSGSFWLKSEFKKFINESS